MAAYIDQFERIRTELGFERSELVGQSYGAGLVIHYALTHANRGTAVIVTNSRSGLCGLRDEECAPTGSGEADPFEHHAFTPRRLPYHPIHARRFPTQVKQALVNDADRLTLTALRSSGRLGRELHCTDLLDRVEARLSLVNGVYESSFQSDVQSLKSRYPQLQVAAGELWFR